MKAGRRTEPAAAWLFGALIMAYVQIASSGLPGNDSYYHMKMAWLLPSLGFADTFPWLHWTIFRDAFVSHHHGFHVLLAPLVWLSERLTGDLMCGGKAAVVIAMGATAALLCALLRCLDVRRPLAWVCLLCCLPWHFWLRLSYVRAPILALPLLLAALLLVLRNRPVLLGILAFAFAHVYGGVVLFPLIPLALLAGHLLARTAARRHWILLAATMAGLVAGLVIHPYFPRNLAFLKTQVLDTGLGAPREVGNEWKPYDAWFLLKMSAPLALLWLACLLRRLRSAAPSDGNGIGLLLLNVAFLVLTLKARRFVEYWPVFALLNAAQLGGTGAAASLLPRRRAGGPGGRLNALARWSLVGAAVIVALATLSTIRLNMRPNRDHAAIRAAMTHLRETSPAGSLVFTDDWDVFPVFFYYNHHNHYAVGLDPVFTQSKYPALWERYKLITRGRTPGTLPTELAGEADPRVTLDDIAEVFGAAFVVDFDDHPKLFAQLSKRSDRFVRTFPIEPSNPEDRQPIVSVFRVEPRPGS